MALVLVFVLNNILTLGILRSAISHLPGCFCPRTFFHNIGFNVVPSDPFMSHLDTQLGYSTGEFQVCNWLSLRRLASWVNHLPSACWSTFWKLTFKQQLGCRFDIMDCKSPLFYWYFEISNCICLNALRDFFWLYRYILNSVLYFHQVPLY